MAAESADPWRTVLVAVLVVAAGCMSAPTAPSDATDAGTSTDRTPATTATEVTTATETTATPTPEQVRVVEGSLGVDASVVWSRVENLTGADVAPPTVSVEDADQLRDLPAGEQLPFVRVLGIRAPERGGGALNDSVGGLTISGVGGVRVRLYLGRSVGPAVAECVLAHEFGHAVQFRRGFVRSLIGKLRDDERARTIDSRYVRLAVQEGAAMDVQRHYAEAFGCRSPIAYGDWVRNGTAYEALVAAPYYYGERYVDSRVDSPADHDALLDPYPTTTEQVLHPDVEEPPVPLSVTASVEAGDWVQTSRYRVGELVTRVALARNLSADRAATAAAGWGNDTVLGFSAGQADGYAWVLRWDDAGEADEFEAAFGEYLDARADRDGRLWVDASGRSWRVVRTSDRTVVVLVGDRSFVRSTTVRGDESVAVVVGNESTTLA